MSKRIAVVGDVHGDVHRLGRMLVALRSRGGQVVLVGDYVDRGPASADVLDLLAEELGRTPDLIALAGNHETELARFVDGGDFVRYAAAGGMATIRSYVGQARGNVHRQFVMAFPPHHDALIRSLPTHYEDDKVLISHAGFDPVNPSSRAREAMVDGRFRSLLTDDVTPPRSLVVCGHYVQRSGQPLRRHGMTFIDTGCGTIDGPLTALLLPEDEFVAI